MKTPVIYETRVVSSSDRPDSISIEELANGAFKKSLKAYVDRNNVEDCRAASDWLIKQYKALDMVFPSKAAVASEEIRCLKGQVTELENKNAALEDELREVKANAEEFRGGKPRGVGL